MTMNERTESKSILPTHVEVLHVDILVRSRLPLAPEEESFFGSHFLHRDVLNGKSKDNGPNESKGHLGVTINNFFRTNGHQLDSLGSNKVQCFVDIRNLVK